MTSRHEKIHGASHLGLLGLKNTFRTQSPPHSFRVAGLALGRDDEVQRSKLGGIAPVNTLGRNLRAAFAAGLDRFA